MLRCEKEVILEVTDEQTPLRDSELVKVDRLRGHHLTLKNCFCVDCRGCFLLLSLYVHISMHIHAYILISMYVFMYVYMVCMYVYVYIYAYVFRYK